MIERIINYTNPEGKNLNIILKDGYSCALCPSGLAMLSVIHKKGIMDKWFDYIEQDEKNGFTYPRRFNISIYKHPERISNWSADDFREVIKVGNDVKYARLKTIIDIFAYLEKYRNNRTGNMIADDILNAGLIAQKNVKK